MKTIEEVLKINYTNKAILEQALTHSSYANENDCQDNERLEFLGDAVIGLLMADYLYKQHQGNEGEMSKKRAQAVCEEALNVYATKINLAAYLKLGRGGEISNGRDNPSIISDAFEAVFGSLYIDQGFLETKKLFDRIVIPQLKDVVGIKDYKSTLQELVQTDRRNISYHIISQTGPSHDRVFTASVWMDDIVYGTGSARSKKEAEQNAAKEALNILVKEI
ncbi:MAG TPA: ribonuclease III [Acholeplasma sp.]|nr:ribonuclease III [Acholeplasma sp.]